MYVACRQLKISVPGEDGRAKVRVINPGETIPGVEAWGYPQIIAHLNAQLIKWTGKPEIEAPHNAHKQRGVVIPFGGPRPRANPADPRYQASAQPPAPQSTPAAPAAPTTTGTPAPAAVSEAAPGSELACPGCDRDPFKTAAALKSHIKFKHPELAQPKAG